MAIEKIRPRVVDATGNYTFNDVALTGNISAPTAIISNLTGVTNLVAASTTINVTGVLSVTSNVSAGNIKTDNLLYANGSAWPLGGSSTPPAGSNTQVQFNDTSSFGASANFTFNKSTNTLLVTNISANGAQLSNLTGSNITGQVANAVVAETIYANAQPNITSVGTLTSLTITGNLVSGNASLGNSVTSNYFIGDGTLLSSISGGNVTGQVAYAATANSVSGSNVVGQVTFAATANAVAGSNVMGTVSQATYATTANSVAGSNVSGTVANATYATSAGTATTATSATSATTAATVTTNAQPNITSVGNLSILTVDNGSYGNVVITQFASIFATGNGPNPRAIYQATAADGVTGIGIQAYSGLNGQIYANTGITFTTGATIRDKDYPTGGTTRATLDSTGLSVTGNITSTNANLGNLVTANYFSGSGNNLSNIQAANVSGQVANALIAGTVTTAAQPNITSVGTLTSLTSTGNVSIGTKYFLGNGFYLTGVDQLAAGSADVANSIANGTSNVNTPISGGNITVGVGGVANTVIFTSTGVNIAGHLTATANVTGSFIKGNGFYLTGVDQLAAGSADVANSIANGTSNVNTPISGGNITVGIGGTSNTVIFTSTGVNVAGYISPSTGSGTNGIIWPSNPGGGTGDVASIKYYAVTGEQTRLEINVQNDVAGSIQDDIYFTTNSYVVVNNATEATSTSSAPFQVLGGAGVAKKLYVGGNIEAGTNYIKGNGFYLTGVDQLAAGSADIANSIANGTSNINTPISGGNITVSIGGVANTVVFTSTGINVAGNISTAGSSGNLSGANYVIANYFTGTLTTSAQPNITSVGTLTNLSVTGNVSAANLVLTGNLTISGTTTTVNSTTTSIVDPIFELGGGANGAALTTDDNKDRGLLLHYYSGASIVDAFMGWDDSNGEFAFGSNVTLSSEVATFNSFGNVRANIYYGNGSQLTGVGAVSAGYIQNGTSNVNIVTSGGNVTLGVGGTANVVIVTPTGANISGYLTTTGNASVANLVASSGIYGTLQTATQTNITSVGTLTGLTVTGNIISANANLGNSVIGNYFIGNGSQLTGVISATVTTNAQPNITSVGTLTGLVVGNATANTIFGNGTITATGNVAFTGASVSLGAVGNLSITGGAADYYLKTDGTGQLSWSPVTGGGGGGGVTFTSDTTPPASGNLLGDQWYNTSTNTLYEYMNDGTSSYWIDIQTPASASYVATSYVNRSYTADGTTATYTVTSGCGVNDVLVFLNGLCQMPTTDYTISGTILTLDAAPSAGTIIQIRELPR